jgi:hypothetical protein
VSADARHAGLWIPGSADRRGMPFAIVDRNDARIYVFEASGRLSSASSALLGQARGDHSAPGVGERTQAGADRRMSARHPLVDSCRNPTQSRWRAGPMGRLLHRPGHSPRSPGCAPDSRAKRGSLRAHRATTAYPSDAWSGPNRSTAKWFSRSWDAVVYVLPQDRLVRETFDSL